MKTKKHLIAIVGPTAVGKTSLSIELAKLFKTEILSADSRQFYQEMSIGTAKPSKKEMNGVTHHFINNKSIQEDYSAGQYEIEALAVLNQIFEKHDVAIVVGGSGLFLTALTEGLDDIPATPDVVRQKLNNDCEQFGLEEMAKRLLLIDPEYHQSIDLKNTHRVLRGLEVFESSGFLLSQLQKKVKKERPFDIIWIGLELPREQLYLRINQRVDLMMKNGLIDEVQRLKHYKGLSPLKTVGYQEFFEQGLELENTNQTVELIKRNSRRYAKRQLTWFRKNNAINWFSPENIKDIVSLIHSKINSDVSDGI